MTIINKNKMSYYPGNNNSYGSGWRNDNVGLYTTGGWANTYPTRNDNIAPVVTGRRDDQAGPVTTEGRSIQSYEQQRTLYSQQPMYKKW